MLALIQWLVAWLPAPVRRRIPPASIRLVAQFGQFGIVGTVGFLVDTAVVYAMRDWAGLYIAGFVAYLVAVATTWWLNRVWTFRGLGKPGPKHHQFATFVVATLPGLCLNLGSYFVLVATVPVCVSHPVIAIAAGAVAGMFANFVMSRAVVFR